MVRGAGWNNNNSGPRGIRVMHGKLSLREGGGREKAPCLSTHVGDASYLYIKRGWTSRVTCPHHHNGRAAVPVALLERSDTNGWYDLLEGPDESAAAIDRLVKEGHDGIAGEDLERIYSRAGLTDQSKMLYSSELFPEDTLPLCRKAYPSSLAESCLGLI